MPSAPSSFLQVLSDDTLLCLIVSFGESVDCVRWSSVAAGWRSVVLTSPTLFSRLCLPPISGFSIWRPLLSIGGDRLVRIECANATDDLLSACCAVAPNLRELLVAPCPDLTSLPTSWTLEVLDVRGSILVLESVPAVCASLQELHVGWWKESDPDGNGIDPDHWTRESIDQWRQGQMRGVQDFITMLADRAQRLRVLRILGHVFPANFGTLANLPNLEELHLTYAGSLTNGRLNLDRLTTLQLLKTLNLRACKADIPRNLQNMESINMSCTAVTMSSLLEVTGRCPALRVLDLCYAEKLHRTVLPSIAEHRHPLEMLGLGGFALLDEDLELIIRAWPGLHNLGIGGAKVSSQALLGLVSLPFLRRLCAHQLEQLEESVVWQLLERLQQVDLDDCVWTSEPSPQLLEAIKSRPYDFDYY